MGRLNLMKNFREPDTWINVEKGHFNKIAIRNDPILTWNK